jgi:molecular chaperone DnaK
VRELESLNMKKLSSIKTNSVNKVSVIDVAVGCYGVIEKIDGEDKVIVLINKGDEIPCSVTRSYFTQYDNQTSISLKITQSDVATDDPKWVQIIWDGALSLPPGRKAGQQVDLTCSYDENGTMHASFVDVASGDGTYTTLSNTTPTVDEKGDIDKFIVK